MRLAISASTSYDQHKPQPLHPERFDSVICGLVDKAVDR
ncbi:hypothetical protein FPSE_02266 [Fusarium pseudograminearum CS3096]|uniref:Uncharacterized protein n=1 Tax=Fusarium pseudograminearum (strain CS3096) TaxID=1028729 RepID=K3VUB7_FUSPC|nr:hypothetical protein FPSE_02266 [Fusarium pseudograminearum CS3096]EKJ77768.1 hypothetical protein FPSE_02266 [Fusarium pseudograminearum CS3096]